MPYPRIPFATSGDRAAIPATDPGTGVMNQTAGYGPFYGLDPATNPSALRLARQTFNQLMYDIQLTQQQFYQWGVAPFIESSENGGSPYSYAKGAMVQRGGVVYQSNTGSNTTAPPSASWTEIDSALFAAKAPTASPVFTGNPTAPTPTNTDNDTSIATTAFVRAAMALFGAGTTAAVQASNLNNLTNGGLYRFEPGATGSPSALADGVILHMPFDTTSQWMQFAVCFDLFGTTWVRYKQGGVVGSWIQLFNSLTSDPVIANGSNANGIYAIRLSGRKEIWRTISAPAGTSIWALPTPLDSTAGGALSFALIGTSAAAWCPAFTLSTTGFSVTCTQAVAMTVKIEGI